MSCQRLTKVRLIPFLAAVSWIAVPSCLLSAADRPVKFEEWMTPSKPPFPHDPEFSPDGTVWYTGQRANVLGHLFPKTGEFKEYPLPTPDSGPHGLTTDKDGNIWYTGNSAALIGKLDVKTGKITEHKMPDPKATDPHTPIFDKRGILWFTVQAGNFVGTLDPKTGKIVLVTPPTANSRPYGIKLNSKQVPFFDQFNSNRIGSIDPETMKITEYPLPNAAARPRRIEIAADDTVYYTDYGRGFLGHVDPKTGKVDEYPSPGGPRSRPYAIAITSDGGVWYCETGDEAKNMLIRFDPATKKMESWNIPSGGSTVRHMVLGKNDELWLAESGVGKIARVQTK